MFDCDGMADGKSAKVGVGVLVVKRGQGSPKVLVSQRYDGQLMYSYLQLDWNRVS